MSTLSNKILLYIDTSSHTQLVVEVGTKNGKKHFEEAFDYRKSQGVLPLIEKVFKKEGLHLSDITEISVNTGPGSFTGLRVGVAIVNTLGAMLQIPINNQPVGVLAEPQYE